MLTLSFYLDKPVLLGDIWCSYECLKVFLIADAIFILEG